VNPAAPHSDAFDESDQLEATKPNAPKLAPNDAPDRKNPVRPTHESTHHMLHQHHSTHHRLRHVLIHEVDDGPQVTHDLNLADELNCHHLELDQALQKDPNDLHARLDLARLLFARGMLAQAADEALVLQKLNEAHANGAVRQLLVDIFKTLGRKTPPNTPSSSSSS